MSKGPFVLLAILMNQVPKRKDWIRPKSYAHLSQKLFDSPAHKKFIYSYVTNPANIEKHCFYPFIHLRIKNRRYKQAVDYRSGSPKNIKTHSYVDKEGQKKSNIKTRKIYYATHIDSQIYSYYAIEVLGKLYEQRLKDNSKLSECICAYRRIPVFKGAHHNKSNIHFANEAFQFIKEKVQRDSQCVAITMDITEFFDSLDHGILYNEWSELLSVARLPKDHFAIYRSLTNFTYINLKDLLRIKKCRHINDLKKRGIFAFFQGRKELREAIKKYKFLKTHPFKTDSGLRGIPQGTSISAFLANLYLYKFDELICKEMQAIQGFYRRYSDDIIIICDIKSKSDISKFLVEQIQKFRLVIQAEKTQTFLFEQQKNNTNVFKQNPDGSIEPNIPLKYLGFEFDGKNPRIKSSSLSKFYRQMKKHVRIKAKLAKREMVRNKTIYPSGKKAIFLNSIYKLYSHLGKHEKKKRNYYIYATDAARIMGSEAIKKQLKRSWKNLYNVIDKHVKRRELNEINELNKQTTSSASSSID